MGDDYQDLVELGFEGVGRLTDKYHDYVYDHSPGLPKKFPGSHRRKGQTSQPQQQGRRAKSRPSSPPPPPPVPEPPRSRSANTERKRRDSFDEEGSLDMYEDDDRRPVYAPRTGPQRREKRDGGLYEEDTTLVVRGRDGQQDPYYRGGYEVAPRIAPPPRGEPFYYDREVDYSPPRQQWAGQWAGYDPRGRPRPYRRSSSYSPPRRPRSPPQQQRRLRSKSPNHQRVTATLVGALAGGLIGNASQRGKYGTASTVGGAIVGGLVAREGEKYWDRHEEKKAEEGYERTRRRERDYGYY